MTNNDILVEPFKVYVRIRPVLDKEIYYYERHRPNKEFKSILIQEEKVLFVIDPDILELNVRIINNQG
jgi:hypothetical protein